MSSSLKSDKRKPYKAKGQSNPRDMTDTEFYKDIEGGDPHPSDVLKSIRS